jgi:tRNA-uridine 2-sulfurtransferase
VADKQLETNTLIVVQGDHPLLYNNRLRANGLHWIAGRAPTAPARLMAKTRYRQPDQACTLLRVHPERCEVAFDRPQRAVTPGQSVVFYRGEECLGGGVIDAAWTEAARAERRAEVVD